MATSKQQADPQVDTTTGGQLIEVLTEAPNGHRTVVRGYYKDRAAAEKQVSDNLESGQIVGAAVAGAGLGSGDRVA